MKLSLAFCGALLLCVVVVAANPKPAPGPLFKHHAHVQAHAETGR